MFAKLQARLIGQSAEKIAKDFLLEQGLLFVAQNFHSRHGEIDLIFKDNQHLVFIEVRYRQSDKFGQAVETVTKSKQQKIIKATQYYLQYKHLSEALSCRFDVLGITPSQQGTQQSTTADQFHLFKQHRINWVKNAFYPE